MDVDFEAVLLHVSVCQLSLSVSLTTTYQIHKCFVVDLQIVCSYEEQNSLYLSYERRDCAEWLLNQLDRLTIYPLSINWRRLACLP